MRDALPDGYRKLLKVPEVMERLNVSNMTVYRLINDGEVEAIRVGAGKQRQFRVYEDTMLAYQERNKVIPGGEDG